ncbi:MAG: class I SAM-dependent methyltransferase [Parvularcula sp.]
MSNQQAWDRFWSDDKAPSQAATITGENQLNPLWKQAFAPVFQTAAALDLVDLATGSGSVVETALDVSKETECCINATCVDYSSSAIRSVRARLPGIAGLVADCAALPIPASSFDWVVSQYGIEYAPPEAFSEAARITRPGGQLLLVCHYQGGAIDRECGANADALVRTLSLGLLGDTATAFNAAAAQRQGKAPPPDVQDLQRRIATNSAALRQIAIDSQGIPAGPFIGRIYHDLDRLFRNMAAYPPKDVATWCEGMEKELRAYRDRMQAMTQAALTKEDIEARVGALAGCGVHLSEDDVAPVRDGEEIIAWKIRGIKPPA